MRARWHKWLVAALLGSACSLNPQPDLPLTSRGDSGSTGTSAGASSSTTTGGTTGIIVGGGGSLGAGGSGPATVPADAGPSEAGASGTGEAGESGVGGEAGAAGAAPNVDEAGAR
jgi:hypothetical protein